METVVVALLILFGLACMVYYVRSAGYTERRTLGQLGQEVQTERERMTTLINVLPEAVFVVDQTGQILVYNSGALAILNTHDDLRGRLLSQLLTLQDTHNQKVEFAELIQPTKHIRRTDLSLHVVSQPVMLIDLRIAPLNSSHHATANYVVMCRDITKERTVEQRQEEFIAIASHELRTPLTIAEAALSSVLLPSPVGLSTNAVMMVGKAHRNILFLSELVTDLTTLSEAQNDAIDIQPASLDPAGLLEQLAADYRPEATKKGLVLDVELPQQRLSPILTTEHHLHEILQNFLTNAIKYTSVGHIHLSVKKGQDSNIIFCVSDSGPGISPSDQKQLFTKFFRSEDYRTRETGGTGLGLYLCVQLAKRLNGRVWCESTVGQGANFYVQIPSLSQLKRDRGQVIEAGTAALISEL